MGQLINTDQITIYRFTDRRVINMLNLSLSSTQKSENEYLLRYSRTNKVMARNFLLITTWMWNFWANFHNRMGL